MAVGFRFLSCGPEDNSPTVWLEAHGGVRQPCGIEHAIALYFPEYGPVRFRPLLERERLPQVDTDLTPLVIVTAPRLLRGVIWTAGEVEFLSTPLRRTFPGLHRLSKQFLAWLSELPRAHPDPSSDEVAFSYFLRGELLNFDSPLFVFPSAMDALRRRTFFVGSHVGAAYIDTLCRELRLQGILCTPPEA